MRLISKYTDYYDGIIKSYYDNSGYLFVRDQRDLVIPNCPYFGGNDDFSYKDIRYHIYFNLIGFCGVIYPVIKLSSYSSSMFNQLVDDYFYSAEEFYNFIPVDKLKLVNKRRFFIQSLSDRVESWFSSGIFQRYYMSYEEIFNNPKLLNIFDSEKIAYFYYSTEDNSIRDKGKTFKIYPVLSDLKFYRVYDIHECYQKLEHYLTNELTPPDEINVVISDELKAQSHGFNKYSFRKDPGNKKKKKSK